MLSLTQSKLNQPSFPHSKIIGLNAIPEIRLDSKPDTNWKFSESPVQQEKTAKISYTQNKTTKNFNFLFQPHPNAGVFGYVLFCV